MAFKPSASVTLDDIRFAVFANEDNALIDAVVTADSGGTPGAAMETFSSITVPNVGPTTTGTILTENSQAHPVLTAGTTYWLVLQPHAPTSSVGVGWDFSSPAVQGNVAHRTAPSGAWSTLTYTQAAFEILGTPAVQASTTTALRSDPNPSTYGDTVTFTATVSSQYGGTPTGTVQFEDGSTVLDTKPLVDGRASFSTAALTAGSHTITAVYSSDGNFTGSQDSKTQTVNRASLTVTADAKSKTYGDPNPTLTGTLTGVVNGDNITANYSTAATQFSDLLAGGYPITATLNDPGNRLSNYVVTNTPGTLTINKASQTITWSDPAAITYGTALSGTQLNATVAGVPGGTAPGALTYTPAAGTILNPGTNQLTVSAAGTTNYNPATLTVYINVLTTASQQAEALIQEVNALVLPVSGGQANVLKSGLTWLLTLTTNKSVNIAKVNGFIAAVTVLQRTRILKQAQANPLIQGANSLLVTLNLG